MARGARPAIRRALATLAVLAALPRLAAGHPGHAGAPPLDPDRTSGPFVRVDLPAVEAFAPPQGRPHPIIVVVIDAARPDHLGLYGYARDTSPTLDALGRQGLVFTQALANAPWTKPSLTSILTGLLPSEHGVQEDYQALAFERVTLAEALKQAGYRTAAVMGNGNASAAFNLHQGFDRFVDTRSHWRSLPTARQVFDQGLAWLARQRQEQRLFLLMHVVDPHDPYHTPDPRDEQRWLWPGHPRLLRTPRWEYPAGKGPTRAERQAMIALYDAALRYTDTQLGYLTSRLDKLGLLQGSTLIVTSDHGEAFGEHGVYLHAHHHYEEHVRVPLVVRSPLLPVEARGRRSDVLVQLIDLFPSVLRLAGVAPAVQRPGVDLLAAAAHPASHAERVAISEYHCYGIHRTMLRSASGKVVLQTPADEKRFLAMVKRKELLPSVVFDREVLQAYDLASDPHERADLAAGRPDAALPPHLAGLLARLRAHLQRPAGQAVVHSTLDADTLSNLRALGYIE